MRVYQQERQMSINNQQPATATNNNVETGDTLDAATIIQAHQQLQQQAQIEKPMWLTSWKDHLASSPGTTGCLELCDLNGDNNYQLVIATLQKRLKVFSGTSSVHDSPLLDIPVGVVSFFSDYSDQVRVPLLAVASAQYIFMYKSLRPYFKFTLPNADLSPVEVEAWSALSALANKPPASAASGEAAGAGIAAEPALSDKDIVVNAQKLEGLKESGTFLSNRSIDFLSLETLQDKRALIERVKGTKVSQPTVVTCLAVVKRDREDADGVGQLLVGTESQKLLLLDRTGAQIQKKTHLPSVPVHFYTSGITDADYRVVSLCRDGRIYICKNGELQPNVVIQAETMITCFCRLENNLVCGNMTNQLLHFSLKGTRVAAIPLPCPVVAICPLVTDSDRQPKTIVVALANNEIRVYTGKTLINKMPVPQQVLGLRVGRYGTEDSCLCVSFKSGVVSVLMLPRTANLNVKTGSALTGPPKEQDKPLQIPKRTNIYVEQMARERENALDMYRSFHKDVSKLRLMTTRAYARIATDVAVRGSGDIKEGFATRASLRLNCGVSGLGPSFRLRITLQNTGSQPEIGLFLVILGNGIYSVVEPGQPRTPIPSLVPSVIYTFDLTLAAPENYQSAESVKVLVCGSSSSSPLVSEKVEMPMPDGLIQSSQN